MPSETDGSIPAATAIDLAWDGRPRGRLWFGDNIREEAWEAVRRLRDIGIHVVLLSGDRADVARVVAGQVGISDIHAPLTPDEKIEIVQRAARSAGAVAMIGDGINDAPALAAAAVGIALGAGTDLARQSGNVVLLSDHLLQIPWLIKLSRQTRLIIRQNLLWAFGYNGIALTAAALGLLHPLIAAVAMLLSSLTVLGNSIRLQRFPDA